MNNQGETREDKIWMDMVIEGMMEDNEMWIETQPYYEEYELEWKNAKIRR